MKCFAGLLEKFLSPCHFGRRVRAALANCHFASEGHLVRATLAQKGALSSPGWERVCVTCLSSCGRELPCRAMSKPRFCSRELARALELFPRATCVYQQLDRRRLVAQRLVRVVGGALAGASNSLPTFVRTVGIGVVSTVLPVSAVLYGFRYPQPETFRFLTSLCGFRPG